LCDLAKCAEITSACTTGLRSAGRQSAVEQRVPSTPASRAERSDEPPGTPERNERNVAVTSSRDTRNGDDSAPADDGYARYIGLTAPPLVAANPLEHDTLRRFVQAIMDADPVYHDEAVARESMAGGICAPPLYPLHAFRRPAGTPDPFDLFFENPDADGAGDGADAYYGLEHIKVPFNRILNGGNEVELFRCLNIGEKAVASPRYASVTPKTGTSGDFLLVVIETRFTTELGELLMIARHTMVWR